MNKEEYTPWYPSDVHPSVPGVYQVQLAHFPASVFYAYWNGKKFGYRVALRDMAFQALKRRDDRTYAGDFAIWRGLTKQSFLMMKEMKYAL